MSIRRVVLSLLFLHGTIGCQVDWRCETCVHQGCHYVLTETGKSACLEEGGGYSGLEYMRIKDKILCSYSELEEHYFTGE